MEKSITFIKTIFVQITDKKNQLINTLSKPINYDCLEKCLERKNVIVIAD
jgi:hypothetical protein